MDRRGQPRRGPLRMVFKYAAYLIPWAWGMTFESPS